MKRAYGIAIVLLGEYLRDTEIIGMQSTWANASADSQCTASRSGSRAGLADIELGILDNAGCTQDPFGYDRHMAASVRTENVSTQPLAALLHSG
jgi:hypothetical protein